MDATTVLPPFTVTPRAVQAIEQLGGLVSLTLEAAGCCGWFWTFALEPLDAAPGESTRFGCPGAWLEVSAEALAVLPGATLDHAPRLRPPRFRVLHNPNTEHVCPCRRSFGRPWPGPGGQQCRSYAPMPWDEEYTPPDEWQRRVGWTRA